MADPKDENETPDHCELLPYVERRIEEEKAKQARLLKELMGLLGEVVDAADSIDKLSE